MKFKKYLKIIEADIRGSGIGDIEMVHGRTPEFTDAPEEKSRMLQSLDGKSVSLIRWVGSMRMRIDGVLSKGIDSFFVKPEKTVSGVVEGQFEVKDVERIDSQVKSPLRDKLDVGNGSGIEFPLFTIYLK